MKPPIPNCLLHTLVTTTLLGSLVMTPVWAGDGSHSSAGLWGPATPEPPESLTITRQPVRPGSFEFVPLTPVFFDTDKSSINYQAQLALDSVVDYLMNHDNITRIIIEGHADYRAGVPYNDGLSDRRIERVRAYLAIKGVDPKLMTLTGRGELAPVDINWSRDGRRRNRHVAVYAVHWRR